MCLLFIFVLLMVIVIGLVWFMVVYVECCIVIIYDLGLQGLSLEMFMQMVVLVCVVVVKEVQDVVDVGWLLVCLQQIKLLQMEVSVIVIIVDGCCEVLLCDVNDLQNIVLMQYLCGVGDLVVQFIVGQIVNFELIGNDQGWQLKDNQGCLLEYLFEVIGLCDIFDIWC